MIQHSRPRSFKQEQIDALKEIKAARAAQRLKISPTEALKLRQKSIHRLQRFEIGSIVILAVILGVISYHLVQTLDNEEAYKAVFGNEATIWLALIAWSAVAIQGAFMLRASFMRVDQDDLISEDTTDTPFRGWRFTLLTPFLTTLIFLPPIIAGVFNDDSINSVGSFFLVLTMSFIALLLSALVAPLILAPLEMIGRGIVSAVRHLFGKSAAKK